MIAQPNPAMPGKARQNAFLLYLMAGILALCSACAALASCGIYPFGSTCFTYCDNLQLFAPDFGSIGKILDGTDDAFFSFSAGGVSRSPFLIMWHSLFFPTTWIATILPHDNVAQAQSWSFILNWILITLSSLFYFRNTFRSLGAATHLLLALGYLLSSFVFTKYTYIPFYHFMAIFPCFMYSLDRVLMQGKCLPYIFILGYLVAFATYFGYMFILFASLYAACTAISRFISREQGSETYYFRLAWSTIFVIIAAAFMWFPSYILTGESIRGSSLKSLKWLIAPDIERSNLTPWLCAPLAFALAACLRAKFLNLVHNKYAITFLILTIHSFFHHTYSLWHGGAPIAFPLRYGFMLQLTALAATASLLSHPECRRPERARALSPGCIAALLVAGTCTLTLYIHRQYWLDSGFSHACLRNMEWISMAALLLLLFRSGLHKTMAATLACLAAMLMASEFRHNLRHSIRPEDSITSFHLAEWGSRHIPQDGQDQSSRTKVHDYSLNANYSQFTDLRSITNFFHSSPKGHQETMGLLGYRTEFTRITDQGGTLFSDSLLGIEYIISDHRDLEGICETRAAGEKGNILYRNPFYWGFGYVTAEAIGDIPLPPHPVQAQERLASLIIPGSKLFSLRTVPVIHHEAGCSIEVGTNTGLDYIRAQDIEGYALLSFADASGRPLYSFESEYTPTPSTLIHIPAQARRIIMKPLPGSKASPPPESISTFSLDKDELLRLASRAAETAPSVSYAGRTMTLHCTNGHDKPAHLILPIFYSRHYTATVNGTKAEPANGMGFVAIPLPGKGKHAVTLSYGLPWQAESLIVSCAGSVLLLVLLCYSKRRMPPKTEDVLGRLLMALFFVWLLFPACTGMACLGYRLMGRILANL